MKRLSTRLPLSVMLALFSGGCATQVDQGDPSADGRDLERDEPLVPAADVLSDEPATPGMTAGDQLSSTLVRPYRFRTPPGHDPARPTPLVVLLHGYSVGGWLEKVYLGLGRVADEEGFLLAYPDGLADALGLRFWNATDACCNLYGSTVDDVAYLRDVIDDMAARFNVDPARIFLFGHSNGGFMAYRMACDLAPRIAGIVSLEAAPWRDPARCPAGAPVSVLHIHGTWDPVVPYPGGWIPLAREPFPSARATVAQWASLNGCEPTMRRRGRANLEAVILGEETEITGYDGCAGGSDVELWTIHAGGHLPVFTHGAMTRAFRWLAARPKR
jgi:polyhydroxybutyrate depolymerase